MDSNPLSGEAAAIKLNSALTRKSGRAARIALLIIVLLAVLLRVFGFGHTLLWDEAWNAQTVSEGARGLTSSVFFNNFWHHPPLYLALGIAATQVFGLQRAGTASAMELISLLFALLSLLAIYVCGRDWFGEKTGLAAAFLYAVMPASRAIDIWIKPESMTLFFGLMFLIFYFRRKHVTAGVFLGLALLTKETALFFPLAVLGFIVAARRFRDVKGLAISSVTAFVVSFWWYLFCSRSTGQFADFFIGRGSEAKEWHQSWSYYFLRLPSDIGWPILVLAIVALMLLAYYLYVFRRVRPSTEYTSWRELALFCLMWFLTIYALLAFSYGKPSWMIYSALPAIALFGGWCSVELVRAARERWLTVSTFVVVLFVIALALSIAVGFNDYMLGTDAGYRNAQSERLTAQYINGRIGPSGKTLLYFGSSGLPPHFLFYLDSYDPKKTLLLPKMVPNVAPPSGATVLVLDGNATFSESKQYILKSHPDAVALIGQRAYLPGSSTPLAVQFEKYVEPEKFRVLWVFDGKKLADALTR